MTGSGEDQPHSRAKGERKLTSDRAVGNILTARPEVAHLRRPGFRSNCNSCRTCLEG